MNRGSCRASEQLFTEKTMLRLPSGDVCEDRLSAICSDRTGLTSSVLSVQCSVRQSECRAGPAHQAGLRSVPTISSMTSGFGEAVAPSRSEMRKTTEPSTPGTVVTTML